MLLEQVFERAGIGTLRCVGDIAEGEEFKVQDIAVAEFETVDGILYAPLTQLQVVLILSCPRFAVQICRTPESQLTTVARLLGMDGSDA